jgi:hypothetical protein
MEAHSQSLGKQQLFLLNKELKYLDGKGHVTTASQYHGNTDIQIAGKTWHAEPFQWVAAQSSEDEGGSHV